MLQKDRIIMDLREENLSLKEKITQESTEKSVNNKTRTLTLSKR